MRRFISLLIAATMLANLAAWPSLVLAEEMDHEQQAAQFDGRDQPAEPSPVHCQHGCHYGQHFQGQVASASFVPVLTVSESVAAVFEDVPPQHVPALPFRPPLTATIQS